MFFILQSKHRRPAGRVIKIIKRAKESFVGILEKENGEFFLVRTIKKFMWIFLFIKERTLGAVGGEKVLAKIIKWDNPMKVPEGEVVKILGQKGDHNVEMESIVWKKALTPSFLLKWRRKLKSSRKTKKTRKK